MAENLWREISPSQVIFDEWDFRYVFFKHEPRPLSFRAVYEINGQSEELLGLMPLVDYGKYGYGFFAEEPCEENRVFVKPGREDLIPLLYKSLSGKVQFYDISGEDEFTRNLPLEDYKYLLPLSEFSSFNDFLRQRLPAKRRKSLEKELAEVEALRLEVVLNDFSDLEELFRLNVKSFGRESYLWKKKEQLPWRELIKENFSWRLISLRLSGRTVAASLSVYYQGYWHYLLTGVDFSTYPGLGKYLNKVNIEMALSAGARYFDAGLGACGWKDLWHFERRPQYEYLNF